jgi:hypothetical protein
MLPLNHLWLLSLLLLVKDVNGILQFYEPCPLSVKVLYVSFGVLSDCLPSHDRFLLLSEPLYLLLYTDQLSRESLWPPACIPNISQISIMVEVHLS